MFHPSSSRAADPLTRFLPIAPRDENQVYLPGGTAKKYETPEFMATIRAMGGKLFELQGAAFDEEPTTEKEILKKWKASNNLIYGSINVS